MENPGVFSCAILYDIRVPWKRVIRTFITIDNDDDEDYDDEDDDNYGDDDDDDG